MMSVIFCFLLSLISVSSYAEWQYSRIEYDGPLVVIYNPYLKMNDDKVYYLGSFRRPTDSPCVHYGFSRQQLETAYASKTNLQEDLVLLSNDGSATIDSIYKLPIKIDAIFCVKSGVFEPSTNYQDKIINNDGSLTFVEPYVEFNKEKFGFVVSSGESLCNIYGRKEILSYKASKNIYGNLKYSHLLYYGPGKQISIFDYKHGFHVSELTCK